MTNHNDLSWAPVRMMPRDKFEIVISDIIDKVREEPARPRGCHDDNGEDVVIMARSHYDKICGGYEAYQILGETEARMEEAWPGGGSEWKEARGNILGDVG